MKKESESHRLFIARGFTVADAEETPDLVVVTTEPEPKEEEKIIDPQNPWDIMSLDEMKEYLRGQGVSFGNSGEKRLRELVKQSFTGE